MNNIQSLFVGLSVVIIAAVSCQKAGTSVAPAYDGPVSSENAVDLGLSVLWSGANMGAASVEQYGDFYAWGETKTKSDYSRENYTYYNGDRGYSLEKGSILLRDIAFETFGKGWSIPSPADFVELQKNTKVKWASVKGVDGWVVTSKVTGFEGVSIFFPAAGYKGGTNHNNAGEQGLYYSNQLLASQNGFAQNIFFKGDSLIINDGSQGRGVDVWCGYPVRPIKQK